MGGDWVSDGGAGQVSGLAEGGEGAVLGVNTEKADGGGGIGEDEGGCDGTEQDGLAGPCGAYNEDVSDVWRGKAGDERQSIVGESQEGGGRRQWGGTLQKGEEGQGGGVRVGEGQGNAALRAVHRQ